MAKGSAKSVTSSYLSKAVLEEGATAKLHPSSNNIIIATAAPSEKQSHSSKSQLAVKRQRSALWIAKAHLLSTNSKNMAANLSAMKKAAAVVASQNNHLQPKTATGAATTASAKEHQTPNNAATSATMHCFTSPKGPKKFSAGVPMQPQFTWQRLAERSSPPPPGSGVPQSSNSAAQQSKHRKSQQPQNQHQSARHTVEKFLKKRVGDQLAIFSKAGAVTSANNNHSVVTATKVGEVFSSLAKSVNSRASTNMEIAQMFKASASHHLSSQQKGGAGAAAQSKKKRVRLPSAKQILSSMAIHHSSAAMRSQATTSPQILISLNAQVKNQALNSAVNQSQVGRAHGTKVIALPMGIKTNQRSSQSRLETFEIAPAAAVGVTSTNLLKQQRTYRLPIHKLKKRLKQRMTNNSLQNLQESLLFTQFPRESRTAMRHSGRPKNTVMTSRSKSKSPTKKMMSFQGSQTATGGQVKPSRVTSKRQAALKVKKAASRLCERPSTTHEKNLFKLKGGSLAVRVQATSPPVPAQKSRILDQHDVESLRGLSASIDKIRHVKHRQDNLSVGSASVDKGIEPKTESDLNRDHQKQSIKDGVNRQVQKLQSSSGLPFRNTDSIKDPSGVNEKDDHVSAEEVLALKHARTDSGTDRRGNGILSGHKDELTKSSADVLDIEADLDDQDLNLVIPIAPEVVDANGEIDPRVTEAVLRELGKYCQIQVGQDASEEDFDDVEDADEEQRASHRSHDNIGYVASPLIRGASSDSKEDQDRGGSDDKPPVAERHTAEHRRAFSEHEIRNFVVNGSESLSDQDGDEDDDADFCVDDDEHSSVPDDVINGAFDGDCDVSAPDGDSIQYEEPSEFVVSKSTYNNLPIPKSRILHIKSSSQGTIDQEAGKQMSLSDLNTVEKVNEFGLLDNNDTNEWLQRSSQEASRSINEAHAAYKAIESLRNTRHLQHAADKKNQDVTELLTVSNEDMNVQSIAQEEKASSEGQRHASGPMQAKRAKPGAAFVATHYLGVPKSPSNMSIDNASEGISADGIEEDEEVASGNGGENEDLMLAVADEHHEMSQDWQRVVKSNSKQ